MAIVDGADTYRELRTVKKPFSGLSDSSRTLCSTSCQHTLPRVHSACPVSRLMCCVFSVQMSVKTVYSVNGLSREIYSVKGLIDIFSEGIN